MCVPEIVCFSTSYLKILITYQIVRDYVITEPPCCAVQRWRVVAVLPLCFLMFIRHPDYVCSTLNPFTTEARFYVLQHKKTGFSGERVKALKYFWYKPCMDTKVFFLLKSSWMSLLALSASFEYICYESTAIIHILLFQCRGDQLNVKIWRLQTSDFDALSPHCKV